MRQLTTWTARGSWADWRIRAVGSSYDMRMTTGHKGSLVGGSCKGGPLMSPKEIRANLGGGWRFGWRLR